MIGSTGSLADVPLAALFHSVGVTELERIREAGRSLDGSGWKHRGPEWSWFPQHAEFPGRHVVGTPQILLAEMVRHDEGGDSLSLVLDVTWGPEGGLRVTAAVNAACWCEVDHATHDVDSLELAVGTDVSLGAAFERGVEQMLLWSEGQRDPSYWRSRAGFPSRGGP